MTFTQILERAPIMLAEGAVIERLRRDRRIELDPHVENAGMIYDAGGRVALERIIRGYLDIGEAAGLPMVVLSPTWRANLERLRAAGFDDGRNVNEDAVRLVTEIRSSYGPYADRVYVGGLMGCKGDAYDPREALVEDDAVEFHRWQVERLRAAGVDFLIASTLPAAPEARGLARAMAESALPYILSVVLRPSGELLDGTPLHELVSRIDSTVSPAPLGHMCNCVHPTVFAEALERQVAFSPDLRTRMIGLQANASARSPEELERLDHVDADKPESFAEAMLRVHERFGMRILGGCCGTDDRHIRCIAQRATSADG
jgi:homocysteine S-methyltransferase